MTLLFPRGRGSGAALLLALSGLAGCVGPAMAMGDINTAQAEVSAAQTAEAPKLAPYEYTLAQLYLERARDRMGTADYQEAYEYARKSAAYGRQAVAKDESRAAGAAADILDAGYAPDAGTISDAGLVPEARP